ncbi:MAG: tRNA nucleotidyltransferase [Desulfobacterales bacterium]|nr:MAG: tRNA nucleotidyltransferase [Desulfobacterales bacterium]
MEHLNAILGPVIERPTIRLILDRLLTEGHRAMLVGGVVRDGLLGHAPEDVDILTDAPAVRVEQLFSDQKTRLVGVSFPIILVNGVEVATSRAGADFPKSDLSHRDLTINAMAWDPVNRSLVDPFGGQQDLKARVVRFTGDPEDRIAADPIRMIRACRFAARLGGTIEPASFEAICKRNGWIIQRTAAERRRMEVVKAMAMDKPSLFFNLLYDTGLLTHIFPSLARCYDLDGGPHHGETVFEHCLLVGDALPAKRPLLRLAGYLHDTGKFDAAVIKDGKLTFAGHEKCWDAMEKDLMELRFSNKEIQYIRSMFRGHMRPLYPDSTPRAVRRLMAMLDELALSHEDFLRMRIADRKGNRAKPPYTLSEIRVRLEKIMAAKNRQTAFNINDLKISGKEIQTILGLEQGPAIGQAKAQLFEMVLETPDLNTHSNLVQQLLKIKHGKTNG